MIEGADVTRANSGMGPESDPAPSAPTDGGDPAPVANDAMVPEAPSVAPRRVRLQEFFIPIHGLVRLHTDELPIVNHPAFQHLGYVYQLGQTYLVYRGATHTRFEHALGTRHVVDMMIEALKRNCSDGTPSPDDRVGDWALDLPLNPTEERFVRLGALLHDIGHLPAGHTLEDELGLLSPHDGPERLSLVWNRKTWLGVEVERTLRDTIDEQFVADAQASGLLDSDTEEPLSATDIIELLISKEERAVRSANGFRYRVCRDIIGNTICADLLDYLHRDWLHIGKQRTLDTRLLEYLQIRTRGAADGSDAQLVIYLRGGHQVRTDAVTAILDLLESRYQLAEIALFHKTKLCAAAMLERSIAEIGEHYPSGIGGLLSELPERLLDATDTEMLTVLSTLVDEALRGPKLTADDRRALEGARRLAASLRTRNLHKVLVSFFEHQLPSSAKQVQELYSGPEAEDPRERARIGARHRLRAVRLLERDFEMEPGSIVMYCPPRKMNTKIADVRVLLNQEVYPLAAFEGKEKRDRGITGGHLEAQEDRFRRLWRVQFAIDRSEKARLEGLGLLEHLGRAILYGVLRQEPPLVDIDRAMFGLAAELTGMEGSPLYGRRPSEAIAARGDEIVAYPGGAPSLFDLTQPG